MCQSQSRLGLKRKILASQKRGKGHWGHQPNLNEGSRTSSRYLIDQYVNQFVVNTLIVLTI